MIHIIKNYIDVTKSTDHIRTLINDMQENITAGKHTIKSQTIKHLNEVFTVYKKNML